MNIIETVSGAETQELVHHIQGIARPLHDDADLDPLMHRIGSARHVLIGEATHGTSEFYTWRARLSKRLIQEKGFAFVAVEGDWPDCYRVNRYAKGRPDSGRTAHEVLTAFNRWPTWMWANREVVSFVEWMRRYNQRVPKGMEAGFYGLDMYSLWESLDAITHYLGRLDPGAAATARQAYRCFEPYGRDAERYALATRFVPESCEDEVITLLADILRQAPQYPDGDREALFNVEQNAFVLRDAERYYRTMMMGGAASWNVRDTHMADTLERLMGFHGEGAKGIVWEHNTHVGDARATDMARQGMVNIGQLARERHGLDDVVLIGFGTYQGSVIAADTWEAPMEVMVVPPARQGSWEDLMHRAGSGNKLLLLNEGTPPAAFGAMNGHRAVGVVYDPKFEAFTNYVPTVLAERYDAFLYIDETEALNPLHLPARAAHEVPETFPVGV